MDALSPQRILDRAQRTPAMTEVRRTFSSRIAGAARALRGTTHDRVLGGSPCEGCGRPPSGREASPTSLGTAASLELDPQRLAGSKSGGPR